MKTEVVKIDVSTGTAQKVTDFVAEEKPLYLFLNRVLYATIFCSPTNLKELAIGHVLSEGVLKSVAEIEEARLEKRTCRMRLRSDVALEKRLKLAEQSSRVIFSACGSHEPFTPSYRLRKIDSTFRIKAETLLNCVANLNHIAEIFRKTGGTHVAAIYGNDGKILALAEDVGRHNAVDKVIGKCALKHVDFERSFLALSGRLTGDIVMKAARAHISLIGSLSAAIDSGIKIAKDANVTLVGFVRGRRMNVYCFAERILS